MNAGKCLTIEVRQRKAAGPAETISYRLDIGQKGSVSTHWIHKNQSFSNGTSAEDQKACTKPIAKVNIGDSFLICLPLFDLNGRFFNYAHDIIEFKDPLIEARPPSYKYTEMPKYFKPELAELLKNELAKSWPFYKMDYYHSDLNRVCEVEDLINQWHLLDSTPEGEAARKQELMQREYHDLVDKEHEFQQIINYFDSAAGPLKLVAIEIGGTYVRVLKLHLKAVLASASRPRSQEGSIVSGKIELPSVIDFHHYPLFDLKVKVSADHQEALCNEVKRKGLVIDLHETAHLHLRQGDGLIVYL